MEFSIEKVLELDVALNMVLDKDMPVKLSYWLGKLKETTTNINKRFNEENKKLLDKYAEADEKNMSFSFATTEDRQAYDNEINDLKVQKEEVKVPELKLADFEGMEIKPAFFTLMSGLIKED
ncbi:hypothetical protein [Xanthovirga aplysinae]|uniref:hypothetical protein n=1 Tax=Xanthovirga aplysinae TaxID=2529853 RepID=UPI0012BCA425|nr:hypothetical protein [Xanthovirga aplysinae]MTI31075.1 hypothetical protein [Xanthovirga aplysinae]